MPKTITADQNEPDGRILGVQTFRPLAKKTEHRMLMVALAP